jgi:hypothetical protein
MSVILSSRNGVNIIWLGGMGTVSRWVALKIVLLTLAIYFAAAVTYVAVDAAVNRLWFSKSNAGTML